MNSVKRRKQKANAVFEGGGVKGIGIAGALTVASRYYEWEYTAGTSAGAIIAAMVAAGYTPEEIRENVSGIDYRRFQDADNWGCLPVFGPFFSLKHNLGLYRGSYIENWMRETLKAKGIEHFGDLIVPGRVKTPQDRYRLRVVASDISRGKMLILPHDIATYGTDPDYLDIAAAVRMSISIPYFFHPVRMTYQDGQGEPATSYIVDGGVLSNFPVWLFDNPRGPESLPTFGFKLVGPREGCPNTITGPLTMFKALFATMADAHDNRYIEEKNFARTVAIPTLGVRTTDFTISREKVQALYDSGVLAAEEFFQHWDLQRYLARYVT